ncbi:hypothetical protein [Nocardioides sp. KR10-350]|uniref:hypothetical protein n=1 Tax=Nocardioides cheoyonin TaxID=3156615 RepID=UPI0032B5EC0C
MSQPGSQGGTPQTTPQVTEPSTQRARWRRPWVITVAAFVVVAVLAAAGVTSWILMARHAAEQVSTRWRLVNCTKDALDNSYFGHPVIRSRPGWRCGLVVTVRNRSGHDIHTLGVVGGFMGTIGGAEIKGLSTQAAKIHDGVVGGTNFPGGEVDATWAVEMTVPAHSSRHVDLAIAWRQSGCNGAGRTTFPGWPIVVFKVLGRTHHISAKQALVLKTFDDPHDKAACRE